MPAPERGWGEEVSRGRAPSALAEGQREQARVPAALRQVGELVDVVVSVQLAVEVAVAEVEEQALDQQVHELLEEPRLERLVAAHELEGPEHVVLFLIDPLQQSVVCVHDNRFRGRPRISCSSGSLQCAGPRSLEVRWLSAPTS